MTVLPVVLVVVLIFLNGATDASNAIASSVSSGALSMRRAAFLAAVCNTAGGIAGMLFFGKIRQSVTEQADFGPWGESGVIAVLAASAVFTFFAWRLHLPTSESHALLASAAGASLVLGGQGRAVSQLMRPVCWMLAGAAAGFLGGVLLRWLLPRFLGVKTVRRMQIFSAGCASFWHGVQDLAKFLALLGIGGDGLHPGILMLSAGVMGLGTLCGGRGMTEAAGEKLAALDGPAALAADLGTSLSLFWLSWLGIPSSTTHARTCAAAGCAAVSSGCCFHGKQFLRFLLAWVGTFPVCTVLGAFFALLLRQII